MEDDPRSGDFEGFGGRHVPEPLEEPLEQLAQAFDEIRDTDRFRDRFRNYRRELELPLVGDCVRET